MMTSILYSQSMTKTPILPESVQPGRHYSFKADMKLNAWALVAVAVALGARESLKGHGWGAPWNSMIALAPLVPSLLYVRSIARWIGGVDELQRRIQLEAALFATTATVFLLTSLSLLEGVGSSPFARPGYNLGWGGAFAGIILFYILGGSIFN